MVEQAVLEFLDALSPDLRLMTVGGDARECLNSPSSGSASAMSAIRSPCTDSVAKCTIVSNNLATR